MFPEWGRLGGFPRGAEAGIEAAGRGPRGEESGTRRPTVRGPSSRSLRAERRRRRRRRRRERCSWRGREPCQENTTGRRSPSMPAALRSVAGPRALLPPLSPHLGPIVGLGAPGEDGGKDAARGERGEETARTEESAREGWGGEPCATACPRSEHGKVVSVQASAPEACFARRAQSERAPRNGVQKPKWRRASVHGATASFLPHRSGCRSCGCLRSLPGPGLSRV